MTKRRVSAILLGGSPIAYSVARSLGAIGVPVYVLGDAAWDTVGSSRFCAHFVDLGSGADVGKRWIDWLEAEGPRDGAVLPCNDDGLELIACNRARLVELGYRPIEANDEVLLAMLDKQRTYELAVGAGVDAPKTVRIGSAPQLDAALKTSDIGFPCALKPLHSHLFARHFGMEQKVFLARSRSELEHALSRVAPLCIEMLLTEIIPGPDDAHFGFYTYLDEEGEPLLLFTKRKLRQFPPGFGLGSYHVASWHEDVAELGLGFCQRIGLRGLANVEFKRDERDGVLKLIECNHRFTLANELLCGAGIDPGVLTYNRLIGLRVPRVAGYREGGHLWAPVRDVRAFLAYRRRGELTFRGWVRSLLHRQHLPQFQWNDPGPSIAVARRTARHAAARLRRGRDRRSQ
jgi:D-aspartate ligase